MKTIKDVLTKALEDEGADGFIHKRADYCSCTLDSGRNIACRDLIDCRIAYRWPDGELHEEKPMDIVKAIRNILYSDTRAGAMISRESVLQIIDKYLEQQAK